ncbi:CBO0543 family protein [Neobacillus sp. D3-1R]|uniref:CBO0543 family protein n=1 Tax=Neobacillus sp. D3-1R TaxID=3445778 RepID=UPI003FA13B67
MWRRSRDMKIQYGLLLFGLISLVTMAKKPVKDWIIVFFFKGFISGFIDSLVINKWNKICYPVRFFPKTFKINILYDLLLFPLSCVWFNQWTMRAPIKEIFLKVFVFSIPMTIIETIAEKKTRLLKYKKWTSWHSLLSLTTTFLMTRGFLGLVRKMDRMLTKNDDHN